MYEKSIVPLYQTLPILITNMYILYNIVQPQNKDNQSLKSPHVLQLLYIWHHNHWNHNCPVKSHPRSQFNSVDFHAELGNSLHEMTLSDLQNIIRPH